MPNPYQSPREVNEPVRPPKDPRPFWMPFVELVIIGAILFVLWKMLVPEIN